jgi:hypothetical protein
MTISDKKDYYFALECIAVGILAVETKPNRFETISEKIVGALEPENGLFKIARIELGAEDAVAYVTADLTITLCRKVQEKELAE